MLAQAASTDIAALPVIQQSTVSAKPNLMFVLDDSGSMDWSFMPDDLADNNNNPYYGKYGYWSAQCNGLAYDPTLAYSAPFKADGSSYPDASYTSAKSDGYNSSSSTNDLTGSYYYLYATTGTLQPRMGWTYDGSGNVITTTTFYQECMSNTGSAPGSSKFTQITLASQTAAERQKYANWYSYYAHRILLMRTAVGRAVQALDSSYRVGFSRINSTSYTDSVDFRDAKPFDSTQKTNFYNSLYSASPGGGTPLRGALSKIGRYYAKKLSGQTYDPVEYYCQRNYAMLSTDGYWNLGGSPGPAESSTYGPIDLSGSNVGNQDSGEVRPMYDGGTSTTTSSTPTTTVTLNRTDSQVKATTVAKRNHVVVAGCGFLSTRTTTTPQTRTTTTTTSSTTYTQDTLTSTRVVVVTNGSPTSDTTTNNTTTTTPSSPPADSTVNGTTDSGWVDGTATTSSCQLNFGSASDTFTTPTSTTSSIPLVSPTTKTTPVSGPTAGATTTTVVSAGGSSDTLSDVAEYYYKTDLRNASLGNCTSKDASNVVTDVCLNSVPASGRDSNTAQHMTTFTIGLGVSGTLAYDPAYLTQQTGDYVNLTNGTKNWPPTTTTINGGSGDARNIDDLWHAAVNGRGQYFSALNATALSQAISTVISSIKAADGSGAAAAFSSLAFTSGTGNIVFQAGYTTRSWVGELKAYTVNGATGAVTAAPIWSAQTQLDALSSASRQIYYRQPTGSTTPRAFTPANLATDGYAATYFTNLCSKAVVSSQCASLSAPNLTLANDPVNLANFLRGTRTYEANNTTSPLYRGRGHVLGDIINGAPVYVGKPPFSYTDAGYASFASTNATRVPLVYVGANDGMLHAFRVDNGNEQWAYIPTAVMPNLYQLANVGYDSTHVYYADGQPVVGDIYVGGAWKTILVAGLNSGGKAYYALDITDPANPLVLWEFTDNNLGLTFGNPVITKRADGTWIVAFTSGYNNTTGDGKGHLYVLNANTGAKLLDLPTTAGSSATPSGLAKLGSWVDLASNNTTKRFYAGDLLGNLWRFDIDSLVQPYQSAMLLAQFQTAGGAAQPVTTVPLTALVSGTFPVVAVGTGRYLGVSDISDSTVQSLYVIKDKLSTTGLGVVRNDVAAVKHTATVAGLSSTVSTEGVSWATNDGWWFDLPTTGERISTEMALSGGVLTVASSIPNSNVCISGGASWLYKINLTDGSAVNSNGVFGQQYLPDSIIIGLTGATLSDGTSVIYVKDSTGGETMFNTGVATPPGTAPPQRTSWRELTAN